MFLKINCGFFINVESFINFLKAGPAQLSICNINMFYNVNESDKKIFFSFQGKHHGTEK